MKQRFAWLIKLYLALLAIFVTQKAVFMWIDKPAGAHYSVADSISVMAHGLLLDIPVTGYLIALPLLAAIASVWIARRIRLRSVATAYYVVVALCASVMFVADLSLYPFWKFKLDATIFYYTDSPKDALASVSAGYVALRLAVIAAYGALLLWVLRAVTPRQLEPMAGLKGKAAATLLMIGAAAPLAVSIRGGLGESTANIGKVYFSEDEYLNHAAINPCFSMLASIGKAEDYAAEFDYFGENERARLFDGLYAPTETDTVRLLNTERPNVVVILMESFGGQFVEAVSGRKDIAPNYNRLAREGVIFTNCYSNSFRTDRGTVSALSGYPSFPTQSVMKLPMKSRTLPCLAASLNARGYRSSFIYGGDINFTNMQSYLRTGGYGSITSDVDFSADERKDNPWGANDDVTFARLERMIASQGRGPWHICFLTLSSHEPFEVPYKRLDDKIPNAFAYTDHCLGQFVERLRKSPAWRNLLIVCLPDHGFQYPSDITHEQHHHNSMLWIGGAVRQHRVVSTLMNQSDMPATLLGQLRIPHKEYTFSRDVFSTDYKYPFAFFTFKEGFGFADSTGHTVYGIISDKINEDSTRNGKPSEAETAVRVNRGKAILQSIYDDLGRR
jgi:phosphoglycerol transferase MdoB-like AlkP superfamily enzyme